MHARISKTAAKVSSAATMSLIMAQSAWAAHSELHKGAESAANTDLESKSLMDQGGIFEVVANTLIFLVGAIAVIMLILGGLKYVLSGGNSSSIESAKNTILYAIIGIVVAILSFAAVNFVITQFG